MLFLAYPAFVIMVFGVFKGAILAVDPDGVCYTYMPETVRCNNSLNLYTWNDIDTFLGMYNESLKNLNLYHAEDYLSHMGKVCDRLTTLLVEKSSTAVLSLGSLRCKNASLSSIRIIFFNNHSYIRMVPHELVGLKELTIFKMINGEFGVVEKGYFFQTSIMYLELRANKISIMDGNSFSDMPRLLKLDLGENKLTQLPNELFAGSEKLLTIQLDSNHLKFIPENLLQGLKNLVTVNLADNKLKYFKRSYFHSNAWNNLRRLDLSGNELVTPLDLRGMGNTIEMLLLGYNPFTQILLNDPVDIFSNITRIFSVVNVPFKCDCDIRGLYNAYSAYTKYARKIPKVDNLEGFNETKCDYPVDLAGKRFPELGNIFANCPNESSNSVPELAKPFVGYSGNFCKVRDDTLTCSNTTIDVMKSLLDNIAYSNNNGGIKVFEAFNVSGTIWGGAFETNGMCKIWERISLSHVSFESTQNSTRLFKCFTNLNRLSLIKSNISRLGSSFLKGNKVLQTLVISYNPLTVLQDDVFLDNKDLIDLDLSHNQIEGIGVSTFRSLKLLTFLNIAYNKIKEIWSIVMPTSLNVLFCGHNFISRIPKDTLKIPLLNFVPNPIICDDGSEDFVKLKFYVKGTANGDTNTIIALDKEDIKSVLSSISHSTCNVNCLPTDEINVTVPITEFESANASCSKGKGRNLDSAKVQTENLTSNSTTNLTSRSYIDMNGNQSFKNTSTTMAIVKIRYNTSNGHVVSTFSRSPVMGILIVVLMVACFAAFFVYFKYCFPQKYSNKLNRSQDEWESRLSKMSDLSKSRLSDLGEHKNNVSGAQPVPKSKLVDNGSKDKKKDDSDYVYDQTYGSEATTH